MSSKHIHIISFDVPFPANYGGVIDVFYKIVALHQQGIKVHLHCFEYGRAEALMLEKYCEKVYYYKRKMNKSLLLNSLPFVVVTRSSEKLMDVLLRDNYPILFEGLHCCYHLDDKRLADRIKIVRSHNIEHHYYENLAKVEKSHFKKLYFKMEAKKLKRFEKKIAVAHSTLAISRADKEELSKRYNNVLYLPAFHANDKVTTTEGLGSFCLYHGNLEVGENNEAALYLIKNVFSKLKTPLIIAGRKPSAELKQLAAQYKNIALKADISTAEIDELIKSAQINVLPTFQATGIKLKLLAALFNGRYCVVNTPMVENTGLEKYCIVKDNPEDMIVAINECFSIPFEKSQIEERKIVLENEFSNAVNVNKIIELI